MTTYKLLTSETGIEIRTDELTKDEAWALQGTFAKSTKMRACRVTHLSTDREYYDTYSVVANAGIKANGVNGGENETGIKRLKSIFKTIDKAGDTIELVTRRHNTVATVEELRTRYGL